MREAIQTLGQHSLHYIEKFGYSTLFLLASIFSWPKKRQGLPLLLNQIYYVGVFSLPIIVCSGLFVGMVLSLQGYTTLVTFGAEQAVGQLVALSLVRELGPVVGALLFAGRAGSALTAEIGLMKATDQLDSLRMIGIDPLRRVIGPRFWAGFISLPILCLIFSAVAILGADMVAVHWLAVDSGAYWGNMQASVDFKNDVLNGIIKSIVFGFLVTWIAIYRGYSCTPTAEGIGQATTQTVVHASLVILGADFILTAVMFGGLS